MRSHTILYHDTFTATPLSFWVHHNLDEEVWTQATRFDPPLPEAIEGKGHPMLEVRFDGLQLYFASAQELHHFMHVISQNPLPTPAKLIHMRGLAVDTDKHWLSHFPEAAQTPEARRALFEYLLTVAPKFLEVV